MTFIRIRDRDLWDELSLQLTPKNTYAYATICEFMCKNRFFFLVLVSHKWQATCICDVNSTQCFLLFRNFFFGKEMSINNINYSYQKIVLAQDQL